MSKSAWCDLTSKGNILKLHDKCPNPKRKCQKVITLTPHQYMLESGSKKANYKTILKGQKQPGINF